MVKSGRCQRYRDPFWIRYGGAVVYHMVFGDESAHIYQPPAWRGCVLPVYTTAQNLDPWTFGAFLRIPRGLDPRAGRGHMVRAALGAVPYCHYRKVS